MKKLGSVILVLALVLGCVSGYAYETGSYEAAMFGHNGDVKIAVTFTGDAIENIEIKEHAETAGIGDVAMLALAEKIVKNQTLGLDTVAGATISSTAFLAAVEDCVKQAGGDVEALKVVAIGEVEKTQAEREAQILVVGAGVAGLTAAISAADNGANVLVIEKMSMAGGTGSLAGGGFVMVDAPFYEGSEVDQSLERTLAYWHDVMNQGDANPSYPDYKKLEDVLKDTGKTALRLTEAGVAFGDNPFDLGYAMGIVQGGGAAMMTALEQSARDKGVEILLNCKAEELIVDGDKVVGVKAVTETEHLMVKADRVILATGGFSKNPDMVAEYTPELTEVYSQASVSSTGDGIRMAEAVGAGRFDNYWTATAAPMVDAGFAHDVPGASTLKTATQLGVNAKGERFANEGAGYYSAVAFAMMKDANYPFYFIYDASNADLIDAMEAGIQAGQVFKGETTQALAETAGMDGTIFAETFARYNELAVNGADEDFGKAEANLIALAQAPYYAVKFNATTFGSMGGVLTDANGAVLRQDGTAIENLYAAGEMSNRAFYNQYYIGGASLAIYTTMGFRAGEAAAK